MTPPASRSLGRPDGCRALRRAACGTPKRKVRTSRRLLRRRRRLDANCDQRRVCRVRLGAAGDLPLGEKGRWISRRPAIGGNENFVAATRSRAASGQAVHADDANARTGRPRFALRPGRSGRSDRSGRARWTGFAFRAGWSGRSRIALRAFTAAGEQRQQQHRNNQMCFRHVSTGAAKVARPPYLRDARPTQNAKLGRLFQGRSAPRAKPAMVGECSRAAPKCDIEALRNRRASGASGRRRA